MPTFILSLAVALAASAAEPAKVEIVAHRGSSAAAPENTLAAFKLAWEQGTDSVELDVWISMDGRAVVIHDGDTKRTTGKAGKVSDQTLAQLQALDAGSWKDAKFASERIPTLEEALATVPAGKRMFVEVKCPAAGVPEVLRAIAAAKLKPEQTCVISFSADVVAAAKKGRPDLAAYWIVSLKPAKGKPPHKAADLIAKAKSIGADGLDLSADASLDKPFVDEVKAAGLRVFVWTVDSDAVAKRMVEIGVEGITTNKPAALRAALK